MDQQADRRTKAGSLRQPCLVEGAAVRRVVPAQTARRRTEDKMRRACQDATRLSGLGLRHTTKAGEGRRGQARAGEGRTRARGPGTAITTGVCEGGGVQEERGGWKTDDERAAAQRCNASHSAGEELQSVGRPLGSIDGSGGSPAALPVLLPPSPPSPH